MQHGYTRQHRGIDFIAELSPDVEGRVYIYTAENTSAANGMTITTLNTEPLYKVNCVQPILYGVSGEDGIYYSHQTGRKKYEIKNHLGNVHLVVSDKKVGQDSLVGQSGDGIIDHYTTINTDYYDYYPFAWFIQDRNYNLNGVGLGAYRFGFNGQEKDDEITGSTGSHLDFGARIYDSRVGRFLSPDPIIVMQGQYPELSPYQFASNTPIQAIDLDGLEAYKKTTTDPNTGKTKITITVDIQVKNSSKEISNQEAIAYAGNIISQLATTFSGDVDANTEVVVKVNITNLYVDANNNVILDDFETDGAFYIDFVDEVDGVSDPSDKTGKADKIGNPTVNRFQVRVVSTADKTLKRSSKAISRTGTHEIGHGLGLRHPWDTKNNIGDIKQNNTTPAEVVSSSTIRENIMNTGANTPSLAPLSNRATKSTSGQRKKVSETVPEK